MIDEPKIPLDEKQLEEFGEVAIKFFKKYLSKQELSALQIEVVFNSPKDSSTKTEALASSSVQTARGSFRCRPGPDNGICEPGYRWGWGNP